MADINILPISVQHKNLLFDFYGSLLTEKQRAFFTLHYMDDLSLAEIGEHYGVTPQAVSDLLKRANKLLDGYEAKLGLVKKLAQQKETLRQINALTDTPDANAVAARIRELASEMLL